MTIDGSYLKEIEEPRRKLLHEAIYAMTTYPKLLDYCGWALVTLAGLAAIASIVGIIAVLYASSPSATTRTQERLHETYYVIQLSRTAVIPFGLCLVLAIVIGGLGYSQTKQFVERKISLIKSNDGAKGSPPFHSE